MNRRAFSTQADWQQCCVRHRSCLRRLRTCRRPRVPYLDVTVEKVPLPPRCTATRMVIREAVHWRHIPGTIEDRCRIRANFRLLRRRLLLERTRTRMIWRGWGMGKAAYIPEWGAGRRRASTLRRERMFRTRWPICFLLYRGSRPGFRAQPPGSVGRSVSTVTFTGARRDFNSI